MNKAVQILMLCACIPLCGIAKKDETLEERKQRIMRKYMRERAEVSQSEMFVPSDMPDEDEQITESESLSQTKDTFERHEGGSMPMPTRRPQAPRKTGSSNWLLDSTEEDGESDFYADPFADPFGVDKKDNSSERRRDYLERERSRQDSYSSSRDSRYESRFSRENPYNPDQTESRTSLRSSAYGTEAESSYGRSSSLYGNRESTSYGSQGGRSYSSGSLGQPESRTYGSSPDAGLLTSPYPQLNSQGTGTSRDSGTQGYGTERTRGYTPSYRSPTDYSSGQQQRGNTWGTPSTPSQQQQDYSQPSSLQKWKDKNKGFDPSSDDAYLNEIMPSQRR